MRRKYVGKKTIKVTLALLGVMTMALRFLFDHDPTLTENLYSRGIFPIVRVMLDYTLGLVPFPLIYPLVIALLIWDVKKISQWMKRLKKRKRQKLERQTINGQESRGQEIRGKEIPGVGMGWAGVWNVVSWLVAVLGGIVFVFYFVWGFNYGRLPIENQLGLQPVPLDTTAIRQEAARARQAVVEARQQIPGAGHEALGKHFLPQNLESHVRESLEKILASMGYPTVGRVRARMLWPGGIMMIFGGSGVYFPLTGEAYVPANLTPVEIPFTMAHEMAHGYGFAEEGTANFLAYLACTHSSNPFLNYSGRLTYFGYIASDLYRVSPEEHQRLNQSLPRGIMADRIQKYHNWKRYRGWLMKMGQKVNHIYLKSQGIAEGVKSYNRLIVLAAAQHRQELYFKWLMKMMASGM